MSDTVMSASIRANLLSLQNTNAMMDKTQLHLSTGRKVNSALDNAVSFFTAKSLTDRASDLNNLLDGMGQSISSIKQADTGVANLTKLVEQAKSIAGQARDALAKGTQEAKVSGEVNLKSVTDLTTLAGVVDGDSELVFNVNDKDGNAVTLASSGTVTIGTAAGQAKSIDDLVNKINSLDDGLSAPVLQAKLNDAGQLEIKTLNGGNFSLNFVGDNDVAETTSANIALAQTLGFGSSAEQVADGSLTAGAQNYDVRATSSASASLSSKALYSATNTIAQASDLVTGLFNNSSAAAGTELVDAGTMDATDALVVGYNGGSAQTYNITGLTVQKLVDNINSDFEGKLEASFDGSTGKLNIRSVDASISTVEFGVDNQNTTAVDTLTARFDFGMGNVAATSSAAGDARKVESIRLGAAAADLATFEADYNKVRGQIDALVKDAGYRGTNLLNCDSLTTDFNEDRSTSIVTKGAVLTSAGLGLSAASFGNAAGVESALTAVRSAASTLRTFTSTLANDLTVIQTRQDFTKETIGTLKEGADKLTVADANEEGATMMALQTRQQLAVSALSLASQSQQSVLQLLR